MPENTEKITIELEDFNIEKASVKIFVKLTEDKPNLGRKTYANILGISERTIYRWIKKYDLTISKVEKGLLNKEFMINYLIQNGYSVEKKPIS